MAGRDILRPTEANDDWIGPPPAADIASGRAPTAPPAPMTSAATIAPATPERSPIPARAAALVAVLTLAWGVWATAWFCDDAFIFLRTAENAVGGHGLRWNADERTQTFTSPLWELLLIAGRFVTGEGYFTALVLGAGATAVAITLLVFRIACGPAAAARLYTCSS